MISAVVINRLRIAIICNNCLTNAIAMAPMQLRDVGAIFLPACVFTVMVSLRTGAADFSDANVYHLLLINCHKTVSHHALGLYSQAVTTCHRGSRTRGTRVTGMRQPDT